MPARIPVVQTGFEKSVEDAAKRVGRNLKINLGTNAKDVNSLSQPLGRITGQADEFTKSMEAANARVLAFGASVGIINAVVQSFKSLVSTTIEVEANLAKINSILKTTTSGLNELKGQIFDIARNTEQTFDTVAEAALELSRQGLSATEVTKRLNDALILSRLSGISASEAVAGLTAAVNSFTKAGLTTGDVLNKISNAANQFAVSERDLIEGFKRSASVAEQAGVSIDELGGIITAVQQKTARGGAVIGNSFKTIFTRIGRAENLELLRSIGVEITDLSGRVLPATTLIENLAKQLDKLDDVQVRSVTERIGGGFQIAPLLAALSDYSSKTSVALKATEAFRNATDQAYQKNIVLNQTLSAAINTTALSVKELANTLGELGVTDTFKEILNFFNNFAQKAQDILDGEGFGGSFARSIVKGLSNVLLKGGIALFAVLILKLSGQLAKFGIDSLKTFLNIGKEANRIKGIQQQITATLLSDKNVRQDILALEQNSRTVEEARAKQALYFTSALKEQLGVLQQMQSVSASIAPVIGAAVPRAGRTKRSAGGYLPIGAEQSDIKKGVGGAPSSAKPVVIPNFAFGGGQKGTMVANTSEYIVPNYAGGGDAIFNQDMVKSMGLPSGAKKINAAGGYVPNFAKSGLGVYDSDFLTGSDKSSVLNTVLTSGKMINVLVAPAGAGKTSAVSKRGGQIIKSQDEAKMFAKYLVLSAAGRTKAGGFSAGFQKIAGAAKASGGKIEYLYVPNLEIKNRRSKRLTEGSLDSRSQKALIGTTKAPYNQFDFIQELKKTYGGAIVNSAKGYIPNFAFNKRDEERFSLWLRDNYPEATNEGGSWNPSKAKEVLGLDSTTQGKVTNLYNNPKYKQAYQGGLDRTGQLIANTALKQQQALKQKGQKSKYGLIYPDASQGGAETQNIKIGSNAGIDYSALAVPVSTEVPNALFREIRDQMIDSAGSYVSQIGFKPQFLDKQGFVKGVNDSINEGTVAAAFGVVFDSAITGALGVKRGANARWDLDSPAEIQKLYANLEKGTPLQKTKGLASELSKAEFKNSLSSANKKSVLEKILSAEGVAAEVKPSKKKKAAEGYIPNFATIIPSTTKTLKQILGAQGPGSRVVSRRDDINKTYKDKKKTGGRGQPQIIAHLSDTITSPGIVIETIDDNKDIKKAIEKKQLGEKLLQESSKGFESIIAKKENALLTSVKEAGVYNADKAALDIIKPKEGDKGGLLGEVKSGKTTAKEVQQKFLRFPVENYQQEKIKDYFSPNFSINPNDNLVYNEGIEAKLYTISSTEKDIIEELERNSKKNKRGGAKRSASGYIPNFAMSPLQDAIEREKAAGVPVNQIRINQDGKLRNSQNPQGLAVTNTRDEPTGRIPNFATITDQPLAKADLQGVGIAKTSAEQFAKRLDEVNKKLVTLQKEIDDGVKSYDQAQAEVKEFTQNLDKGNTKISATSRGKLGETAAGRLKPGEEKLEEPAKDVTAKLIGLSTAAFTLQSIFGAVGDEAEGLGANVSRAAADIAGLVTTLSVIQSLGLDRSSIERKQKEGTDLGSQAASFGAKIEEKAASFSEAGKERIAANQVDFGFKRKGGGSFSAAGIGRDFKALGGKGLGGLTKVVSIFGKLGPVVAKVGGYVGRLVPLIGPVIAGFQGLSAIFKLFGVDLGGALKDGLSKVGEAIGVVDSPLEKFANSISEANKSLAAGLVGGKTGQDAVGVILKQAKIADEEKFGGRKIKDVQGKSTEELFSQNIQELGKSAFEVRDTFAGNARNQRTRTGGTLGGEKVEKEFLDKTKEVSGAFGESFLNTVLQTASAEQLKDVDLGDKKEVNKLIKELRGGENKEDIAQLEKLFQKAAVAQSEGQEAQRYGLLKDAQKLQDKIFEKTKQTRIETEITRSVNIEIAKLQSDAVFNQSLLLQGFQSEAEYKLQVLNTLKTTSKLEQDQNNRKLQALDQEKKTRAQLAQSTREALKSDPNVARAFQKNAVGEIPEEDLKKYRAIVDATADQILRTGQLDENSLKARIDANQKILGDSDKVFELIKEQFNVEKQTLSIKDSQLTIEKERALQAKLIADQSEREIRAIEKKYTLESRVIDSRQKILDLQKSIKLEEIKRDAIGGGPGAQAVATKKSADVELNFARRAKNDEVVKAIQSLESSLFKEFRDLGLTVDQIQGAGLLPGDKSTIRQENTRKGRVEEAQRIVGKLEEAFKTQEAKRIEDSAQAQIEAQKNLAQQSKTVTSFQLGNLVFEKSVGLFSRAVTALSKGFLGIIGSSPIEKESEKEAADRKKQEDALRGQITKIDNELTSSTDAINKRKKEFLEGLKNFKSDIEIFAFSDELKVASLKFKLASEVHENALRESSASLKTFANLVRDVFNAIPEQAAQNLFTIATSADPSAINAARADQVRIQTLQTSEGTGVEKIEQANREKLIFEKRLEIETAIDNATRERLKFELQKTLAILDARKDLLKVQSQFGSDSKEAKAAEAKLKNIYKVQQGLGSRLRGDLVKTAEETEQEFKDSFLNAAKDFKGALVDGIGDAILKGESLGDALLNAALQFTQALSKASLTSLADQLIGGISKSGGFLGGIPGFNQGGMVNGGSGTKDDVPAMLTGGEYVIKKSAVQKYGTNFMEQLNGEKVSERVQQFANGGKVEPLEKTKEKESEEGFGLNFTRYIKQDKPLGEIQQFSKGGEVENDLATGFKQKDQILKPQISSEYIMNMSDVQKNNTKLMEQITKVKPKKEVQKFASGGLVRKKEEEEVQTGEGGFFIPGTYGGTIKGKQDLLSFATQSFTSGARDVAVSGSDASGGYAGVNLEPESVRLTTFGRRVGTPLQQATQSAKEQAFGVYTQQLDLEKQLREQEKARKKALKNQLISAAASFAISAGVSGFAKGFGNVKAPEGTAANLVNADGFLKDPSFFQKLGSGFKASVFGAQLPGGGDFTYGGLRNAFNARGYISNIDTAKAEGFSIETGKFEKTGVSTNIGPSTLAEAQRPTFRNFPKNPITEKGSRGLPPEDFTGYWQFGNSIIPYVNGFRVDPEKKATGGYIPDRAGVDTVPAMLSGGEFIMNTAAADRIGRGNLEKMNSGISDNEESKGIANDELLKKLDELIDATKESTGEINITVNGESGREDEDSQGQGGDGNKQFAKKLKEEVVKIIQEEKRLGGSLRGDKL